MVLSHHGNHIRRRSLVVAIVLVMMAVVERRRRRETQGRSQEPTVWFCWILFLSFFVLKRNETDPKKTERFFETFPRVVFHVEVVDCPIAAIRSEKSLAHKTPRLVHQADTTVCVIGVGGSLPTVASLPLCV